MPQQLRLHSIYMPADRPIDEQIAADLREQILNGEIRPGVQIREVELAEKLRVGRYSLRAALQNLAQDGLVTRRRNRGTFVPQLSDDDVRDLFLFRTAIECETLRTAARTGSDLSAAEALLAGMEALTADDPWSKAVDLDLSFHKAIVESIGSPLLLRSFMTIDSQLRLLIANIRPAARPAETLSAEHRVLLEAIRTGSPEVAADAARLHLDVGLMTFWPAESPGPRRG